MRVIAYVLLYLIPAGLLAQSATGLKGIWKGTLKDSGSSFSYILKIDKVIDSKFFGSSISYNETFSCETKIMGNIKGSKITVYEAEIARTNYKNKAGICLLALNIELANGMLTGKYRPITNAANCLAGTVKLNFSEAIIDKEQNDKNEEKKARALADIIGQEREQKIEGPDKKTITAIQKDHSLPEAFITRTLSLVKELIIDADKAEIAIYDNGIIDGDSITLADNGILVFKKTGLSTTALRYTFDNIQTEIHEIAFFADNLGGIPPNTGLMVVTANRKRWEINFSSDFSNTAFVKIILNKKH